VLESSREGDSRQIQQVHKVGVIAQVAISLDRGLFHFLYGVNRACRRRDQQVNLIPALLGLRLVGFELV
jgi:hypothetical protein